VTGALPVILPAVIVAVSLVALYRMPRTAATWVGVTSALTMAVLVPSFSTSAPVAVVAVLGTIAILALALLRDRDAIRGTKYPLVLLLFLAWSACMGSVGSPVKLVLLNLATGVLLSLLAVVVIVAVSRGHNFLLPLFALVIMLEVALGVLEEFFGLKALWPRANGTDVISDRVNSVIPLLAGRAMGTASHPILYGILLAFSVVICLWFAVKRRSPWLFVAAGAGLVGMLFAGSRTALICVVLAVLLWLLATVRHRLTLFVPLIVITVLGAVGTFAFTFSSDDKALLASDSFAHRLGILDTAGNLLLRNPVEVIFGSGFQSTGALIKTGVVHGVNGINVFDEEYIRTLACLGLVGLVLLISSTVLGLIRGNLHSRLLVVVLVVGFATFDALSWRLTATLFVVVIAYGYGLTKRSLPFRRHTLNPPSLASPDLQTSNESNR
jgi:hypothetical protein